MNISQHNCPLSTINIPLVLFLVVSKCFFAFSASAGETYDPFVEYNPIIKRVDAELGEIWEHTNATGVDYDHMTTLRQIPPVLDEKLQMIAYGEALLSFSKPENEDRAKAMLAAMYCALQSSIISSQLDHEHISKNFDIPKSRAFAAKLRELEDQITDKVVRFRLTQLTKESPLAMKMVEGVLAPKGFKLKLTDSPSKAPKESTEMRRSSDKKVRTWNSKTGKTITGVLISASDQQVKLKAGGRVFSFSLSDLSEEDQNLIRKLTSK